MRLYFEDATGDEEKLFLAVAHVEANLARLQRRDQRSVTRRDTDFAHNCRGVDHMRFAGEDFLFRADDIYLNSASHSYTLQSLGLFGDFFDAANHVERLLRVLVHVTVENLLEARDGVLDRYVLTG